MTRKRRRALAAAGLAAAALVAATAAAADWHADCRVRIERRQAELDRADARFGAHSLRARRARRLRDDTRAWCWRNHHAWWDARAHIWMTTHW